MLECREENVTPHVTQNITATHGSRIDACTTRHPKLNRNADNDSRQGW